MSAPVRARRLWTPGGVREDAVVERGADGVITAVRPARPGDGAAVDGLVVPGLVNAHTHVELSHLAGRVRGEVPGFLPWLAALRPQLGEPAGDAPAAAAQALFAGGTDVVVDVSNGGRTAALLAAAGLVGVVQHERIGFDADLLAGWLAALADLPSGAPGVSVRPAPHALFSTAPELVVAASAPWPDVPWPATIHVGEAEDEAAFLQSGTGSHAALLDALGRRWRGWPVPGRSAVAQLAHLGVLGPGLLLVHGVHFDAADARAVAAASAPLCLCPRSNLHVGGRLPDVSTLHASGVRLALGTDSLASCDDLDVLGEVPVLAAAYPDVPVEAWLTLATHGGADALAQPTLGRVAPGSRSGLVQLDVGAVGDLARRAPDRQRLSGIGEGPVSPG